MRHARSTIVTGLTGLIVLVGLAGSAGHAHAGYCGEPGVSDQLRAFERFAKRGGAAPEADGLCMEEMDRKQVARFLKACDLILARDPGTWACVDWGVTFGAKQLGGVDLFLAIAKVRNLDAFADGRTTVGLYVMLGDPRANAPVQAAWQAALADPRLRKKKMAYLWASFRNNAVELFTAVGGAPERAFLAAQVPLTTEPKLRKRMQKAIAAIDARTAAPTP